MRSSTAPSGAWLMTAIGTNAGFHLFRMDGRAPLAAFAVFAATLSSTVYRWAVHGRPGGMLVVLVALCGALYVRRLAKRGVLQQGSGDERTRRDMG